MADTPYDPNLFEEVPEGGTAVAAPPKPAYDPNMFEEVPEGGTPSRVQSFSAPDPLPLNTRVVMPPGYPAAARNMWLDKQQANYAPEQEQAMQRATKQAIQSMPGGVLGRAFFTATQTVPADLARMYGTLTGAPEAAQAQQEGTRANMAAAEIDPGEVAGFVRGGMNLAGKAAAFAPAALLAPEGAVASTLVNGAPWAAEMGTNAYQTGKAAGLSTGKLALYTAGNTAAAYVVPGLLKGVMGAAGAMPAGKLIDALKNGLGKEALKQVGLNAGFVFGPSFLDNLLLKDPQEPVTLDRALQAAKTTMMDTHNWAQAGLGAAAFTAAGRVRLAADHIIQNGVRPDSASRSAFKDVPYQLNVDERQQALDYVDANNPEKGLEPNLAPATTNLPENIKTLDKQMSTVPVPHEQLGGLFRQGDQHAQEIKDASNIPAIEEDRPNTPQIKQNVLGDKMVDVQPGDVFGKKPVVAEQVPQAPEKIGGVSNGDKLTETATELHGRPAAGDVRGALAAPATGLGGKWSARSGGPDTTEVPAAGEVRQGVEPGGERGQPDAGEVGQSAKNGLSKKPLLEMSGKELLARFPTGPTGEELMVPQKGHRVVFSPKAVEGGQYNRFSNEMQGTILSISRKGLQPRALIELPRDKVQLNQPKVTVTVPLTELNRNNSDFNQDMNKVMSKWQQAKDGAGLDSAAKVWQANAAMDARKLKLQDVMGREGVMSKIEAAGIAAKELAKKAGTGNKAHALFLPKLLEEAQKATPDFAVGQDMKSVAWTSAHALAEGDKIPLGGDTYKVKEVDADGNIRIKDGHELTFKDNVPFDKGKQIEHAPSPSASKFNLEVPEEGIKPMGNDQQVMFDNKRNADEVDYAKNKEADKEGGQGELTGFASGGMTHETAEGFRKFGQAIGRAFQGGSSQITTGKNRNAGEAVVQHAVSPEASRFLARNFHNQVFNGIDDQTRLDFGKSLLAERMEAQYKNFLRLASESKTPEDVEKYTELAQKVNRQIGPDKLFKNQQELDAAFNKPENQALAQKWKQEFQPWQEEQYKKTGGTISNNPEEALYDRYGIHINLTPLDRAQSNMTGSKMPMLAKPGLTKSKFARRSLGQGEYSYDPRDIINNTTQRAWERASRVDMFNALQKAGLAQETPRKSAAPDGWYVEKYELPAKAGGMTDKWIAVHPDVAMEVRRALRTDMAPPDFGVLSKMATAAQTLGLGDFIPHAGNLFKSIVSSPSGQNVAYELARKLPGIRHADFLARIGKSLTDIATNDTSATALEARLARIGAEPPAHDGFKYGTGKALELLTRATRLSLARMHEAGVERGRFENSDTSLREFVNQAGQYNSSQNSRIVEWFKRSGLGPFAVAGTNHTRLAYKGMIGGYGGRAASPGQAAKMRAMQLGGNWIAPVVTAAVVNSLVHGSWLPKGTNPGEILLSNKDDKKIRTFNLAQDTAMGMAETRTPLGTVMKGALEKRPAPEITSDAIKAAADNIILPVAGGPLTQFATQTLVGRPFSARSFGKAPQAEPGNSQIARDMLTAATGSNPTVKESIKSGFGAALAKPFIGLSGLKERATPDSPALHLAHEFASQHYSGGTTELDQQHVQAREQYRQDIANGVDRNEAMKKLMASGVTGKSAKALFKQPNPTEDQQLAATFAHLSLAPHGADGSEAAQVWKAATPEQQHLLKPELWKKYQRLKEQYASGDRFTRQAALQSLQDYKKQFPNGLR